MFFSVCMTADSGFSGAFWPFSHHFILLSIITSYRQMFCQMLHMNQDLRNNLFHRAKSVILNFDNLGSEEKLGTIFSNREIVKISTKILRQWYACS